MGDTPSNARLRVLKTVDPQQVIAMLIEENGFDYILDSVLDLEDTSKGVDLSTVESVGKHLRRSSGFVTLQAMGQTPSDEEIFEMARGIYGSWRLVYAACPWNYDRMAETRGIKRESITMEASKARTEVRNSEGTTTNA